MEIEVTEQNTGYHDAPFGLDQGIDRISLVGNVLQVEGWYDQVAHWSTTVTLTSEQLETLRDADRHRKALEHIFEEARYATPYDAADLLIAIENERKMFDALG